MKWIYAIGLIFIVGCSSEIKVEVHPVNADSAWSALPDTMIVYRECYNNGNLTAECAKDYPEYKIDKILSATSTISALDPPRGHYTLSLVKLPKPTIKLTKP
jgi:hypothetical protein